MAAILGRAARHDDGVSLAGWDLVVATRAAVCLRRLVGLHSAHVEAVIQTVIGVVGELVIDHGRSRRLAEERPGQQRGHHDERAHDDRDVAAMLHLHTERVVAHDGTVAACPWRLSSWTVTTMVW